MLLHCVYSARSCILKEDYAVNTKLKLCLRIAAKTETLCITFQSHGDAADGLHGGSGGVTAFQSYCLILSAVQYLVPLTAISFAYVRMGMKLWLNKTPGTAQLKRDQMILVNKKKVSQIYDNESPYKLDCLFAEQTTPSCNLRSRTSAYNIERSGYIIHSSLV